MSKMRGYGLPRSTDIDAPDKGDISNYARPSKMGRLKSSSKRRTRTRIKRVARREGKQQIKEQLNDRDD